VPIKVIKHIVGILILLVILAASIYLLYYLQQYSSNIRRSYPQAHCEAYKEELDDEEMLKEYAKEEWLHWQKSDGSEESVLKLTTTNLQCYCEHVVEEEGRSSAMEILIEEIIDNKPRKGKLCEDFLISERMEFLIELSVPLLIVIIDMIIKNAVVIL